MEPLGAGIDKDRANRLIRYHGEVAHALTAQRTALSSALIPITAYILVACVESYRRYPEMMREIAARADPETLGRAGHRFGTEIDNVRLWALPNFPLLGRKVLAGAGLLDEDADADRMAVILDFWERAARAYRFDDGTLQAWDDDTATPFRDEAGAIAASCRRVRDEADRARVTRLNALLTSYVFLLWFDTRSGYQDSGPYVLPDGRTLLVRSFTRFGASHFPWSADVAADLPFSDLVLAFVLDGVKLRVTDFGTSVTEPDDYLSRVVEVGCFNVVDRALVPIGDADVDALALSVKDAQKRLYRLIVGMERRAKIDAGAYVYFTFLRPFAEAADVELDWTVPRDSLDLYPLFELIDGTLESPAETPDAYYAPLS